MVPLTINRSIYYFRYTPFQRAATGGVKQHHFPYMNQTKSSFKDHEAQKLRLCHKASLIGRFCGSRADLGTCGCPLKEAVNAAFPTRPAQVLDGAKPSSPTGPPTDLLRDFLSCTLCPSNFSKSEMRLGGCGDTIKLEADNEPGEAGEVFFFDSRASICCA